MDYIPVIAQALNEESPDLAKAAAAIEGVKQALTDNQTALEAANSQNQKMAEQIEKLETTNSRLFMQISTDKPNADGATNDEVVHANPNAFLSSLI